MFLISFAGIYSPAAVTVYYHANDRNSAALRWCVKRMRNRHNTARTVFRANIRDVFVSQHGHSACKRR